MQFDQGTTEWFPIQKGVTQSCILSLSLFNLYSEHIKKMGEVGDKVLAIGKVRWKIISTTQAHGTAVLVECKDDMIETIKWVKCSCDRVGHNLNLQKATVMSNVEKVKTFLIVKISVQ